MSQSKIDWDEEIPYDAESEYQALRRALTRKRGFGLYFVECSPQKGSELIASLQKDLPQKNMQVLQLDRSSNTLYDRVADLWKQQPFDVLFVSGLEEALLEYEDTKRIAGWTSKEIYSYSWKGVPRILSHLNQQRERFRDSFDGCFVFLVPFFVIKYLIQRAPDFFDWRSGLFTFPMESDALKQESWKVYFNQDKSQEFLALTPQERKQKIFEIQALIDEPHQTSQGKADLLCDQAFLWQSLGENELAIVCCDKAIKIDSQINMLLGLLGVLRYMN